MSNPYSAPAADMNTVADGQFYQPKMFAMSGRIGRVRYLAYYSLFTLMAYIGIAVLGVALAGAVGPLAMLVAAVIMMIPLLVIGFVLVIRRLNDLDKSGWLSLLSLVPLVNAFFGLYLLFAPGTKGDNQYGPQPTPNSTGLVVAGLILPFIVIIGIIAAVAIPAYHDYVQRAQQAQDAQEAPAESEYETP